MHHPRDTSHAAKGREKDTAPGGAMMGVSRRDAHERSCWSVSMLTVRDGNGEHVIREAPGERWSSETAASAVARASSSSNDIEPAAFGTTVSPVRLAS